jgi:hypothetical protein
MRSRVVVGASTEFPGIYTLAETIKQPGEQAGFNSGVEGSRDM